MSQIAPSPKFAATYVDADGYSVPAVGYKLYTYIAGTTTPKDSYTNYGLGTANANPVVLDARGEANVWLDGNYKLVLKTPAEDTIWTVDDIRDLTSSQTLTTMTLAGALTVTSTAVTWSGNPTHSGNHTWTGNQTFNGNVTVGNAGADSLTVAPNAVTWSNNPTHSGAHTWTGVQTFSANPAGNVVGGTYTPTLTNTSNVSSSTATVSQYIRVGNVVTVSGVLSATVTATSTQTVVDISLPIASNLAGASQNDCCGVANNGSDITAAAGGTPAIIQANTTNNRAQMVWTSGSNSSAKSMFYHFTYLISA